MIKKRSGKKLEAEIGAEPKVVAEEKAIKEKKTYSQVALINAIEDLALKIDNAFFKHPFKRCPDCNKKSNNTVLAYFNCGGKNKIGNLKGFDATIGDVISWYSDSYKGISIVKGKNNGVFELETEPFDVPRKEAAVIERMVIPSMYRPIIGEMAEFLSQDLVITDFENYTEIGKRIYPNAIAEKL